jgi:hypothetical protein
MAADRSVVAGRARATASRRNRIGTNARWLPIGESLLTGHERLSRELVTRMKRSLEPPLGRARARVKRSLVGSQSSQYLCHVELFLIVRRRWDSVPCDAQFVLTKKSPGVHKTGTRKPEILVERRKLPLFELSTDDGGRHAASSAVNSDYSWGPTAKPGRTEEPT